MGEFKLKNSSPSSGFSVVEALLAGGLLILIALAVLPSFQAMMKKAQTFSFRAVCNHYAKAKLQEYVNGVASDSSGAALTYIPSGFEYTKQRYLAKRSTCTSPTSGAPGFREYINNNTIVANDAAAEANAPPQLQGFQLWVLIRRVNPRSLINGQPERDCPAGNDTPNTAYQFQKLGDALEVTVTGMIRTNPYVANGGRRIGPATADEKAFGGLKDISGGTAPNQALSCSVSQIIYPPKLPFRYYVGRDGKVRNYQATLAFSSGAPNATLEAMESHFRSIWSQTPTGGTVSSATVANIRSIAISPDNNTVYIVKPGQLIRYETCTDQSVTVGAYTYGGVPDCDLAGTITRWTIDTNIEKISVDFKDVSSSADDVVYGLFTSGSESGQIRKINDLSGPPTAIWTDAPASLSMPVNPRVRGIFLAQTFPVGTTPPNLFMFDNSCYVPSSTSVASTANWSYCVNVFSSGDSNLSWNVRELPVQVDSISN